MLITNASSMRTIIPVLLFCLTASGTVKAQNTIDTLQLSLHEAQDRLLKENLDILASHYSIPIQEALRLQASYRTNPTIDAGTNLYDGRLLQHNKTNGQFYLQLQQLLLTAGKRNKLITIVNDDLRLSKESFNETIRQLQFLLAETYIDLQLTESQLNILQKQQSLLAPLVKSMQIQYSAGQVSLREKVRMEALFFGLETEIATIQTNWQENQHLLRQLLHLSADTLIQTTTSRLPDSTFQENNISVSVLTDSMLHNRPDLQLLRIQIEKDQHQWIYEKAMAKPDITAGIEYDQRSSYLPNYVGFTASMPLPFFNRNKGNITAASLHKKQSELQFEQAQFSAQSNLSHSWMKLNNAAKLLATSRSTLNEQLDDLLGKMSESYRKKQINLIDFIDFFQGYKEHQFQVLDVTGRWSHARNELNFITNTSLFPLYQK